MHLGPFMVYAAKLNNQRKSRDDLVIFAGFDLDGDAVVDLLKEDGRFKDTMGLPLAGGGMLHFDKGNILVNSGKPSLEERAAGHTSATYIQTM